MVVVVVVDSVDAAAADAVVVAVVVVVVAGYIFVLGLAYWTFRKRWAVVDCSFFGGPLKEGQDPKAGGLGKRTLKVIQSNIEIRQTQPAPFIFSYILRFVEHTAIGVFRFVTPLP